jgi:hypothetical protein
MAKLTLSVDEDVVRRAKRYAANRGTSVSELVEHYLDLLARPLAHDEMPPVLRLLHGAGQGVDAAAHKRHLERKYR